MPKNMARPTPEQQVVVDAIYDLVCERDRLDRAYRLAIVTAMDIDLTPAQIEKFAGVKKQTVIRICARARSGSTELNDVTQARKPVRGKRAV